MTIDAGRVAAVGLGFFDFVASRVRIRRGACAGVTISGQNVIVHDAEVIDNSWPTWVAGRGWITCAKNPQGGFLWGAGIYLPPQAVPPAPLIVRVTLADNHGPAIDAWAAAGGWTQGLRVYGNAGWAAIHIAQSPGWVIADTHVAHSPVSDFYPHPDCYGAQQMKGAAVRACSGSTGTAIVRSYLSGGYAVLAGSGSGGTYLDDNLAVGLVRLE